MALRHMKPRARKSYRRWLMKPPRKTTERGPKAKIDRNRRPKKSISAPDGLDRQGGSESIPPPYETEGPKRATATGSGNRPEGSLSEGQRPKSTKIDAPKSRFRHQTVSIDEAARKVALRHTNGGSQTRWGHLLRKTLLCRPRDGEKITEHPLVALIAAGLL